MRVFGQPLAKTPAWYPSLQDNAVKPSNPLSDISKLADLNKLKKSALPESAPTSAPANLKSDRHSPWSNESLSALRDFAHSAAQLDKKSADRFTAADSAAPAGLKETLEKIFGVSGINGFDVRMNVDARSQSSQAFSQRTSANAQTTSYSEKQQTSLALNMSGRFSTADGRTFEFTVAYQHKAVFEANYVNHVETTGPAYQQPALKLPPLMLDQIRQFLPDWGKWDKLGQEYGA
jgi:hypothetical protein